MPKIIEIILEVVGSVVVLAAMILIFQHMVAYNSQNPTDPKNGYITQQVEATITDVFGITKNTVSNIPDNASNPEETVTP